VYAIFCTHVLGLHTRTQREWQRLEAAVQPETPDLFASRTPPADLVETVADDLADTPANDVAAEAPEPVRLARMAPPPKSRIRGRILAGGNPWQT